jgi:hypothetical protein
MVEIEFSVLSKQCLDRCIDGETEFSCEIPAWEDTRNRAEATFNWQITTEDAPIKLKKLLSVDG